jgi:asparagine synthase (glutamine-hydrolysing)
MMGSECAPPLLHAIDSIQASIVGSNNGCADDRETLLLQLRGDGPSVCGIIGFSGSFAPDRLAIANAAQAHRGPDHCGQFFAADAGIGLGHLRLSILDLSELGNQPMLAAGGAVALTLNGEIYNFRELRAELESKGHRFRGTSDTEVLLALYLQEGTAMLPRLNAMFAFALWDQRDRSLLIARDALGVKPLYYSESAAGFAFASEIKALLGLVPEARELDAVALHRYVSFLYCPGEGTPLRAVRKVQPGEALLVRDGKIVRRWTWYSLPVFRGVRGDLSERDAVAGTEEGLRRAVHRQLVADVPVGAFLSGGLDSSAVVAFARERVPGIRCFTIDARGGPESGMGNDLPYARTVAKHLDVPLDVVTIDADRMATDIEQLVAQLDEPLADPAPLNVLYISALARQHGMKVLLSGAGGDDLFGGYRRHAALSFERYWRWLPREVRGGLEAATARLDRRWPASRRLARLFADSALSGDARIASYFLWNPESEVIGLYSPAFREQLGGEMATRPLLDFLAPLPDGVPPLARMLTLEERFFLPDHNLTYTDKMSMAAGVEVRVPFLDLDLVEHAARVPVALKQRGPVGKWVLKKAMEPHLPHDVVYRPKTGFGAPLRRWMRGELRPLMDDTLSPARVESRGLFAPVAVQRLRAKNDSGEADAAYTLLSLMCIEIWCRTYLDSR